MKGNWKQWLKKESKRVRSRVEENDNESNSLFFFCIFGYLSLSTSFHSIFKFQFTGSNDKLNFIVVCFGRKIGITEMKEVRRGSTF